MSPRTVNTVLAAFPDADNATLKGICRGLVETIKKHEAEHALETQRLNSQINGLAARIMENEYLTAPEGYVENLHYPGLEIPVGHGLHLPVKWVKQLDSGNMACYSTMDGPDDPPHIFPIYAYPVIRTDFPAEPLPRWIRAILHGPNPQYLTFLGQAKSLDDWGVAADIIRYRNLDEELGAIDAQILRLEQERLGVQNARACAEARLEAARIGESLGFLEGLAPRVARPRPGENPSRYVNDGDLDGQIARRRRGPPGRGRPA